MALCTSVLLLFLLAVGLPSGLRPEHSSQAHRLNFSKLGLLSSTALSDPTAAVKDVAAVVNSIMMEAGNATEYMSDDDQELLKSVVELIRSTIYGSMDSSDRAAANSIAAALDDVQACNVLYSNRITSGDLWDMFQRTGGFQDLVNEAQGNVDALTETKELAWTALTNFMSGFEPPPECTELPTKTQPSLDAFFTRSDYVSWWDSNQPSYNTLSDAYDDAEAALDVGLGEYDVALAERDTSYCLWKSELGAGCVELQRCYNEKRLYYLKTLKPALEEDEEARIQAYKAGETVIAQINFLLGLSQDAEPPANIDSSRYELRFPRPADIMACGVEVLDDAKWVPAVSCLPALSAGGARVCEEGVQVPEEDCERVARPLIAAMGETPKTYFRKADTHYPPGCIVNTRDWNIQYNTHPHGWQGTPDWFLLVCGVPP